MTVEELKAVASEMGYSVVKKKEYIRKEKCLCGNKQAWLSYDANRKGYFYYCRLCNHAGPVSKTAEGAKIAWNEDVTKGGG